MATPGTDDASGPKESGISELRRTAKWHDPPSFLGRALTLRGIEYEPDQQHVSGALKALGVTNAEGVATPGTDDVGGPKATEISELRRTAKWHDRPEETKEEDDLQTGEELKLLQSVAARLNFLAMDRPDLLYSVKELNRKNGFTTHLRPRYPHDICPIHNQVPANDLQISMDRAGQQY